VLYSHSDAQVEEEASAAAVAAKKEQLEVAEAAPFKAKRVGVGLLALHFEAFPGTCAVRERMGKRQLHFPRPRVGGTLPGREDGLNLIVSTLPSGDGKLKKDCFK